MKMKFDQEKKKATVLFDIHTPKQNKTKQNNKQTKKQTKTIKQHKLHFQN
jgi:hypothetical protein